MTQKRFALITGSTKGIGKQIALDLLRQDYFVLANYSSDNEAALAAEKEFKKISNDFKIIKSDLSDLSNIHLFAEQIEKYTEKIDVLIFNAGGTSRKDFKDLTPKDWNKVLNIHLTVPFFLLQKLDYLIRNNGRIIFIGSILGIIPHAISIPYGVSKAGVNALAKNLVKVYAPRAITVNVVAPGFVNTEWQLEKEPEHRKRIEEKIALKRFAFPEEVSSTCLHIIENQYMNGQVVVLDGGYDYK